MEMLSRHRILACL